MPRASAYTRHPPQAHDQARRNFQAHQAHQIAAFGRMLEPLLPQIRAFLKETITQTIESSAKVSDATIDERIDKVYEAQIKFRDAWDVTITQNYAKLQGLTTQLLSLVEHTKAIEGLIRAFPEQHKMARAARAGVRSKFTIHPRLRSLCVICNGREPRGGANTPQTKWIQCDLCSSWSHLECISFTCDDCKGS